MKLKDFLYQSGITIKDFSGLLGIHRCYLHQLIGGDRMPSEELMIKIKKLTLNKVSEPEDLIGKSDVF
jgi:transcriptional regulator with XRE-family HTH domain